MHVPVHQMMFTNEKKVALQMFLLLVVAPPPLKILHNGYQNIGKIQ